MDKFFAIQRPDGSIIPDAISTTKNKAWSYACDCAFWDEYLEAKGEAGEVHNAEVGESLGYQCIEIYVAKDSSELMKRIVEAESTLARAREAWDKFFKSKPRSQDETFSWAELEKTLRDSSGN